MVMGRILMKADAVEFIVPELTGERVVGQFEK
jgi:hypothetical protein